MKRYTTIQAYSSTFVEKHATNKTALGKGNEGGVYPAHHKCLEHKCLMGIDTESTKYSSWICSGFIICLVVIITS